MATYTKPGTRYAPSDWFTSNYTISTNAERQRSASHDVRQEARQLRNETDNKTKWDQLDNNTRLADRVDNIRKWKEILEKTLADLDKEIADLSEAKEHTENSLQAKNLPTDVAIECLTVREGRQTIDVVEDEVENQLHKVCLIFTVRFSDVPVRIINMFNGVIMVSGSESMHPSFVKCLKIHTCNH